MEKIFRRCLLHYSALLAALTATTPIRAAVFSETEIKIFKRGDHQSSEGREGIRYQTFFGHSHLSVV